MKHFYVLGHVEEERYAFHFTAPDAQAARDKVEMLLAHEYVPADLEGFPISPEASYEVCRDEKYTIEVLLLVESDAPITWVRGV